MRDLFLDDDIRKLRRRLHRKWCLLRTCVLGLARPCFRYTVYRSKESPARAPTGSPRTGGRAGPTTTPNASPMATVKKPDPNIKNAAASEGVLASFFNSLLSKKTGSPGSPGGGGGGGGAAVATQGATKKPEARADQCPGGTGQNDPPAGHPAGKHFPDRERGLTPLIRQRNTAPFYVNDQIITMYNGLVLPRALGHGVGGS
ncbi:hypothetical protein FKM82_003601 [Ascaphus truei]